jgi:hypothetical protein
MKTIYEVVLLFVVGCTIYTGYTFYQNYSKGEPYNKLEIHGIIVLFVLLSLILSYVYFKYFPHKK